MNQTNSKKALITGITGRVVRDTTKPDGQPRRMLDTSKALREFGFRAKIALEEGLQRTIVWYKQWARSR